MELFNIYLNYLHRTPPLHNEKGINQPNFLEQLLFWFTLFSALFLLIPIISKKYFATWYNRIDEKKVKELETYVICLFHHISVVPIAWFYIYQDFNMTLEQVAKFDYAVSYSAIAPFCIAYLCSDGLFFALPDALKGSPAMLVHHFVTILLVSLTLISEDGAMNRFITLTIICDTPNIFFNLAWILKNAFGYKDSTLVLILEVLFSFFYLILRVIHMPCMFWSMYKLHNLGAGFIAMIPLVLLQWFWFSKVLKGLYAKFSPSQKKEV